MSNSLINNIDTTYAREINSYTREVDNMVKCQVDSDPLYYIIVYLYQNIGSKYP